MQFPNIKKRADFHKEIYLADNKSSLDNSDIRMDTGKYFCSHTHMDTMHVLLLDTYIEFSSLKSKNDCKTF